MATWILAIATPFAFVAALSAAIYAAETHGIEIKKLLGQQRCSQKDHFKEADVEIYLLDDLKVQSFAPLGSKKSDFRSEHYAISNLGRCALVNIVVYIQFSVGSQFSRKFPAHIGNLGPGEEAHVVICRSLQLPEIKILWNRSAKENGQTLELFTADQKSNETVEAFPSHKQTFLFPNE